MTNTNISAVLLAGGESRRMGQDKATLLVREKPLWQIQLDLLRKLEPEEILVSARKDPTWRPEDVRFVADESPSRGPLSGLATTLGQIRTGHLLALAIDMPFMNEEHLRSLCGEIEPGRGVLPMIGDRAEPLAAIYPVEARVDFVASAFRNRFLDANADGATRGNGQVARSPGIRGRGKFLPKPERPRRFRRRLITDEPLNAICDCP